MIVPGSIATPPPRLSVLVPCRNEQDFIGPCLDSILENGYPPESLEVLAIDGQSSDQTRSRIEGYVRRDPRVRLLDNPEQTAPAALNLGLRNASGSVIARIDAHSRLERGYLLRCVTALDQFGADVTGGLMHTVSQDRRPLARAILAAMSHRFGVGNSLFRAHTPEPRWVDTVFGQCYRRELLDRVGPFNERLRRGQDMEYSIRVRRMGGRILLLPDASSYYHYANTRLFPFLKHRWTDGVWAILPFRLSSVVPVRIRHLIPLFFVLALAGTAALALGGHPAAVLAVAGPYATASLFASLHAAVRSRDLVLLFLLPLIFLLLHLAYGLGSLWGLLRLPFLPGGRG